jgi:uncharacterized protein YndB with AHSA1/START domain
MKPATVTTPSDSEVRVERDFDAPVELVWRAYTEPALVRQWMLGPPGWSIPVCEMDVRVGGKYRWRWRSDIGAKEFGFFGEFLEVEPKRRTVQTQFYDPGDLKDNMGDGGATVTVTFEGSEGKTTVVSLMNFGTKANRDAAMATGMTDGMEISYQLLDKVLASAALRA